MSLRKTLHPLLSTGSIQEDRKNIEITRSVVAQWWSVRLVIEGLLV